MNFLLWLTHIYITTLPSGLSHHFPLCSSSSLPALSKYCLNFHLRQRPLNRSQGPHLVSWLSLGLTCGQPQRLTEVPKAVAWLLLGKFSSTCSNSQLPDPWEAAAWEMEPSEVSHLQGLHLPQPFVHDPADVGNLISGSSAFSKTCLNIREFTVHVLMKPGLENFESNCTFSPFLYHQTSCIGTTMLHINIIHYCRVSDINLWKQYLLRWINFHLYTKMIPP